MNYYDVKYNFCLEDLLILIFVIGGILCLIIAFNNFSKNQTESECVIFYKENGYILDSCKKYEEKLNSLELGE